MRKIILAGLVCLGALRLLAQDIPAQRMVNWKLAHVRDSNIAHKQTIDFLKAGGNGDGATANDSVFEAILKQQAANSAVIIYFPKGKYFFTSPLALLPGMVLQGFSSDSTTLIFKLRAEDHLIKIAGTAGHTPINISDKLYKESSSAEVSNAGKLSAGDYVKLMENDSGLVASSWALRTTGQIVKIRDINNNTIYFSSPLRRNYSGTGARLLKMNMITGAGVENLKVVRLDTTVAQTSNIFFQYASDCHVKCIESVNCNFAHVELNNSSNIEVTGNYFHRAFKYGDGGEGYGVVAHLTTGECLVENNSFDSLRHAMLVQAGANGNVFAYNYSTHAVWTEKGFPANAAGDIVLHGNYVYANLFEGNVVQTITIDNSHGINGPNNTFFRNRALLYGLVMSNNAGDGQNFIGNEITNSGFLMGNFLLSGKDNYLLGNNQTGIVIPTGSNDVKSASMFLTSPPAYYASKKSWPPIGPPNNLNEYHTEAEEYCSKGFFTSCSYPALVKDTTGTQDTTTKDTTKAALGYQSPMIHTVKVYPNPTNAEVVIIDENGGAANIKEVVVLSSLGQEIYRVSKTDKINLQNLPDGLYFLNIRFRDNTSEKIKVIKTGR